MSQIPDSPKPSSRDDDVQLDPAGKSLADALQTSFKILRLAMIVLAVAFFLSGVTTVKEGEVAVRTVFGKIVGPVGDQVLRPGGPYFTLPAPLGEIIRVPTTEQRIALDNAFWFRLTPEQQNQTLDQLQNSTARNLAPDQDGSMITGDLNVVHARWAVSFKVDADNAIDYLKNVGDLRTAAALVGTAAEAAAVEVVAQMSADQVLLSPPDAAMRQVVASMQASLDRSRTGITVTTVTLPDKTPPMSVRSAFLEVNIAQSEKGQQIEEAQREWTRIHNEVAGTGYPALLLALDEYERALNLKESDRAFRIEAAINSLLDGTRADEALKKWYEIEPSEAVRKQIASVSGTDVVGGRVSQIVNEARTYRTTVVARVKSESDRFARLLDVYKASPGFTMQRLWADARQEILGGDVETIYLPDDEGKTLVLDINRDPLIRRAREQARFQRQQEAARQTTPAAQTPRN
jgi:modulator of FtsH protease HflK